MMYDKVQKFLRDLSAFVLGAILFLVFSLAVYAGVEKLSECIAQGLAALYSFSR